MSVKMTARVWALKDEELKDARLLTLLSLADYANGDDLSWPSVPTLAKRTRISERQIQRSIHWLDEHGYIAITEKGNGRGKTTTYKLLIKGDISDIKDDIVSPIENIKGDILATKGDIENVKGDIGEPIYSHARREPLTTEPLTEPIKKDDGDNAREAHGAVFTAWAENIPGTMAGILGDRLHDLIDECGPPAVIYGIVASVEAGARNFKYIAACARNNAAGKEAPARASPSANGGGYRGPAQSKTDRKRDAFANVERMLQEEGLSS